MQIKSSKRFCSIKNVMSMAAISLLAGSVLGSAIAEESVSEEAAVAAVEARQKSFKTLEDLLKPTIGMARGRADMDAGLVAANAKEMHTIAQSLEAAYAINTSGFDIKNRSDEKIWDNLEEFNALADDLANAALALEAAAQGGNEKAIKGAIMGVGKSCKSCHSEFRTE